MRTLNRLECVGETLRHALNLVATIAPDWLRGWVPVDWFERYSRRFEEFRLPDSREERYTLGEQIGRDGQQLWEQMGTDAGLSPLRQLPALEALRQVWLQQYVTEEGQLRWRQGGELPAAALLLQTPYDIEARYAIKRRTTWTGYKVHLTESCDEQLPHLIVNVETTSATLTDYEMTSEIQNHLAERDLLPAEHLVDSGYMSSDNLVDSQVHKVDLIGPVAEDPSWQAQAAEGFASAAFVIDWEKRVAFCPQGHASHNWSTLQQNQTTVHNFRFPRKHCLPCPVRAKCTKAANSPRSLTIQRQAAYEALQAARQRQKEETFRKEYAARAGVEGSVSQGVAVADLRRARYVGLAKTRLQHLFTALGMNILRLGAWWAEAPHARTRVSAFGQLAPATLPT